MTEREIIKVLITPTGPIERCKGNCWQAEINAGKMGTVTYWHRDGDTIIKDITNHLKRIIVKEEVQE